MTVVNMFCAATTEHFCQQQLIIVTKITYMASTPEIGNTTLHRISPFSSGINKNLLTPCRRVGLSRKRKTPNSILRISSDDFNSSNTSMQDLPLITTTPVNHQKSFSRRKHEELLKSHGKGSALPLTSSVIVEKQLKAETGTLQECEDNKSKKDLSELFSSAEVFNLHNDIHSPKQEVTGIRKKILKTNSIQKLKKKLPSNELIDTKNAMDERESLLNNSLDVIKPRLSRKLARRLSDDDFVSFENVSVDRKEPNKPKESSSIDFKNVILDDSDEDFKITKCNLKQNQKVEERMDVKKKRIKKTLSMKNKSLSITDDECDTNNSKKVILKNNVQKCKVQLQKLSEDDIYLSESNRNIIDEPLEKAVVKPIIAIADDGDDDDAFTFTPEQEKAEKKNLVQKIKMLETQVRQKRQKFANLKQALIYKNKHDIGSLTQLTSQWVNGCVLGLNDLLGQLQAHGPMSMTTLINNLHISSDIMAKLPLNIDEI